MTEQAALDTFREMNNYDGRDEDWPSDAVFEEPRRTLFNGWTKFHAARDCGSSGVSYIEAHTVRPIGPKYEYKLYCRSCNHRVTEDEVLFIGGDWFNEHGILEFGQTIDELQISPDRVLDLGPDPSKEELVRVLNLTRIERNVSSFGVSFGNESYDKCDTCEKETFLLFDGECRMCYDGEWTGAMQNVVNSVQFSIRERNNSFKHRVEEQVNPLSIKNRAFEDKILWRRSSSSDFPKIVEVTQCLTDDDDGHWEYILSNLARTSEWRVTQDELAELYWDTGLYNDDHNNPLDDDRLSELHHRVTQGEN